MAKPSAEEFSKQGDKYLGQPYSVMDCQHFVEKMLEDVGIRKDLAGSNAWFRKMTWTGTPKECIAKFGAIPKGAFLFIHAFDGGEIARGYKDGLGNASHIGVKTGRGKGAIHSSSSRRCVAESAFNDRAINGGWNMIGLWDALDYGEKINRILSPEKKEVSPMPDAYKTAFVNADGGVNFRSTPSTSSMRIATIPRNTAIQASDMGDGWSKVIYEGKTGYVMTKFITFGAPTTIPNADALSILSNIEQMIADLKKLL